jgi:hypothetical protein
MKVGGLVKMVGLEYHVVDSCRTELGSLMELGIVVDIRKQAYKMYPDVHVLWSDGIRDYMSFQVEAVSGKYVEVVE